MPAHLDPVATTRQTYDAVAAEFKRVTDRPWPELSSDLEAFLEGLPSLPRLLDAGCGTGRDTAILRDRGASVVGVDLSGAMLREACLPGLVQADMRILPLRDDGFDGVWCQAALLHVPRPDVGSVLSEFGRVLRPEGRLHLAVSEGDGEGWEGKHYGTEQPRWFVHHQEAPLRASLSDAGFEVMSVTRTVKGRRWLRVLAFRSR